MLTAPQDSYPQGGALKEDDGRPSPYSGENQPQTLSHPVFSSCDRVERSSAWSSNGETVNSSSATETQNQQHSMENHENMDEVGEQQSQNNSTRSCKRKMDLEVAAQNSTIAKEQTHSQADPEKESSEGPPPAKRWVIGPLFQSFKSKMASFTEIVMSPVRLFKPHETPLLNAEEHSELPTLSDKNSVPTTEEEVDQPRNTPQKRFTVVQRLCFDADSFGVDTRDDLLGQTQSTSLDDGSLKSTSSTCPQQPTDFAPASASKQDCSPNSSRVSSLSLTEDARRKDPESSVDLHSRTQIRSSPRKGAKVVLQSLKGMSCAEGLFLVKATNKSTSLSKNNPLNDVTKHTEYEGAPEGHTPAEPVPQEVGVPTICSKKGKKLVSASSKKKALAMNVQMRLTRSKKEGKVDDAEESPTALLLKAPGKSESSSQQLGDSDKPLTICNIKDVQEKGSISEKSAKSPSSEEGSSLQQKAPTRKVPATSRKTRQRKDNSRKIPSKEKPKHSGGVVERCHIESEMPLDQNGCLASKISSGVASDGDELKAVQTNNAHQAKHKFTATSEDVLEPAAKKLLVHIKQLKGKKAADVFEEQRMSMSLTLQVGSEAEEQKRNFSVRPARDDWPSAGPNSGVKRRGKMRGQTEKPTEPVSVSKTISELFEGKSFSECVKSQSLPNEHEVTIVQTDSQERAQRLGKSKSKTDRQRRKCQTPFHSLRADPQKQQPQQQDNEEEENYREWTQDRMEEAVPVVPSSGSGSNRLLRSFSCPDIPSLLHREPLVSALPHEKSPPSTPQKSSFLKLHSHSHFNSPSKRTRRHTVCSLEIEREIAPLCLRKEVHPTAWASLHSSSPRTHPSSPSTSLAVLATCFLSSPLAFLSKKSSQRHCDASESGNNSSNTSSSRHSPSSSSPRSLVSTSSPFSLKSLTIPCLTVIPAFTVAALPTPKPSSSSVSPHCSLHEPVSVDDGAAAHRIEEDKLLSRARVVSEEKALSDSEIKSDNKEVERRKVSSIRIRKTLPKPQYNLTPMGLPKAIRTKKKDFSVEEIYLNKNFTKPPEGRLETIFEVPLSRRDGSQSLTGQKRVKRFVEFPELGVTRKPKKPLVGAVGAGAGQRKAAGAGRTRRGVFASTRDDVSLNLQDTDSLLCSKLNELDCWMALEQMVY